MNEMSAALNRSTVKIKKCRYCQTAPKIHKTIFNDRFSDEYVWQITLGCVCDKRSPVSVRCNFSKVKVMQSGRLDFEEVSFEDFFTPIIDMIISWNAEN